MVCTIDTDVAPAPEEEAKEEKKEEEAEKEVDAEKKETEEKPEEKALEPKRAQASKEVKSSEEYDKVKVTSVAKEMMKEHNLSVDDVINGLKRLGKKEVEAALNAPKETAGAPAMKQREASRDVDRQRMTSLRRKLSERLVAVKNETAMLTTFNEVDMSSVMELA